MQTVLINKEKIGFFAKPSGHNKYKFNRVLKIALNYNQLHEKFNGIYDRGNFSKHAEMALAVKLLLDTGIRIGNETSAEGYITKPHPNSKILPKFVKTYGLTTLLREHVVYKKVKNNYVVEFYFLGKKHVENTFKVEGHLAYLLVSHLKYMDKEFGKKENYRLFNFTAYELTKFIRKYVGKQFSPKDFRTFRANVYAWRFLSMMLLNSNTPKTKKEFKAEIKTIAECVAEKLNNTPGVCKKSYIDDMLFEYHAEKRGF